MNRGRIFRRRFDTRMDRLHSAAGQIEGQIEKAREHAREGIERGRDAILSMERSLVRNFRQNPSLYLIIGGALLGLLVFSLFNDRRR